MSGGGHSRRSKWVRLYGGLVVKPLRRGSFFFLRPFLCSLIAALSASTIFDVGHAPAKPAPSSEGRSILPWFDPAGGLPSSRPPGCQRRRAQGVSRLAALLRPPKARP